MPGPHPHRFQWPTIAALVASGVIALGPGAPATSAESPYEGVVVQSPKGPLVLSERCDVSGELESGDACAKPVVECPPNLRLPDGTPCWRVPSAEERRAAEREARAERRAQARADRRARARAEVRAQRRAEARADRRAEARAKRRAEARADRRAEARAKRRAEARADRRAEARAKRRAEARADRRAERRADAPARPAAAEVTLPALDRTGGLQPPGFLMPIFRKAGRAHGVPWQILAAINEIETHYGRLEGPSPAGAVGWMQFMPATWAAFGVDADGDGRRNPHEPRDAIWSAARYLEDHGAREDLYKAVFAYNHADWYVQAVLLRASQLRWRDGDMARMMRRSQRRLERDVLRDERIEIYACGREDIAAGRIDRRVLLTLLYLADANLHPTVSSLECGRHGLMTASGGVSHHATGGGVDISAINGTPMLGNQGDGSVTEAAVLRLTTLRGVLAPDQIISLIEVNGAPGVIAMGDHADHIHIGFAPTPRRAKQLIERLRLQRAVGIVR